MSITNCQDCPSLLTKAEAESFFGVAEAAPMCARFGHIFNSVGQEDILSDAATKFASGCASAGKDRPTSVPSHLSATWFQPRPELLEPSGTKAAGCNTCLNHDSAKNACAATGRVIFPERHTLEASACNWGKNSTVRNEATDTPIFSGTPVSITTKPGQGTPTSQKPTPKKAVKKMKVSPTSYSSDAQVTAEHDASGIAAWRKIETKRGKTYFLPIFKTEFFGDRADMIPKAGDEKGDPSLYIDHAGVMEEFAVQVYKKDLNLVLIGEPGTGKTETWRHLAYELNMPFDRISYNQSTDPDQVLGIFQFDPTKGTYFDPGYLPQGWVQPGFLLSDEPNLPDSDAILQAYRSMNDSSRELVVYKERYLRHDYCFHAMAMNPHWDFRNIGARPLASADSRRLSFFWMPNPTKDMMKQIIMESVEKLDGVAPDKALVDIIIKIGDDLRQLSADQQLPDFWTIAQEIKVCRLVDDFGLEGAYKRAYFNYISPEDASSGLSAIKSHIPYGSQWE